MNAMDDDTMIHSPEPGKHVAFLVPGSLSLGCRVFRWMTKDNSIAPFQLSWAI